MGRFWGTKLMSNDVIGQNWWQNRIPDPWEPLKYSEFILWKKFKKIIIFKTGEREQTELLPYLTKYQFDFFIIFISFITYDEFVLLRTMNGNQMGSLGLTTFLSLGLRSSRLIHLENLKKKNFFFCSRLINKRVIQSKYFK